MNQGTTDKTVGYFTYMLESRKMDLQNYKDPQSAHQCTVCILRSQLQVQMSTVELTWV